MIIQDYAHVILLFVQLDADGNRERTGPVEQAPVKISPLSPFSQSQLK